MPQNDDPYATARARMFDLLLCLVAIALILIITITAPKHHGAKSHSETAPRSGQFARK